jgi:hypothetical protein
MKTYGGVGVYIQVFLTSALVGGEWSASRPCRLTPGEESVYPLDRLGGHQSRPGRYGEEKILDPIGTETLTSQSSPATSADVKNTWIYTSTPPYVFMA